MNPKIENLSLLIFYNFSEQMWLMTFLTTPRYCFRPILVYIDLREIFCGLRKLKMVFTSVLLKTMLLKSKKLQNVSNSNLHTLLSMKVGIFWILPPFADLYHEKHCWPLDMNVRIRNQTGGDLGLGQVSIFQNWKWFTYRNGHKWCFLAF